MLDVPSIFLFFFFLPFFNGSPLPLSYKTYYALYQRQNRKLWWGISLNYHSIMMIAEWVMHNSNKKIMECQPTTKQIYGKCSEGSKTKANNSNINRWRGGGGSRGKRWYIQNRNFAINNPFFCESSKLLFGGCPWLHRNHVCSGKWQNTKNGVTTKQTQMPEQS